MESPLESCAADVAFERQGVLVRLVKALIVNPLANYMPAGVLRRVLRLFGSELAAANWADPGGWQSMVISYEGQPKQIADKVLVGAGTMPMALRNRRRLAARVLSWLIDRTDGRAPHVLCLGAGPGQTVIDALSAAERPATATLIDLNPAAFDHGRRVAAEAGLADRITWVVGDVRHVERLVNRPVDIVEMLGLCEYLTDEQVEAVACSAARAMPPGASVICNSLAPRHGTDRFFRRVFDLHMRHRSPGHIERLLARAGLADFVSLPEPLGVYHVVVARKAG